eukprot:757475-Rhodomonas_salina.1
MSRAPAATSACITAHTPPLLPPSPLPPFFFRSSPQPSTAARRGVRPPSRSGQSSTRRLPVPFRAASSPRQAPRASSDEEARTPSA